MTGDCGDKETPPPHSQDHGRYARVLGEIVSNLLTLECVLRIAIFNIEGTRDFDFDAVKVGQRLPLNAMTDYAGLSQTIARYNALVGSADQIDRGPIVKLRDALAHGRVLGMQPRESFTLYKFGQGDGKTVPVEMIVDLSLEWLAEQRALVAGTGERVLRRLGSKPLPNKEA